MLIHVRLSVIHGGAALPAVPPLNVTTGKFFHVSHTGCIDWRRMGRSKHLFNLGLGTTYVYAFWLSHLESQEGLDILRPDDAHPDWFCAGVEVDTVMSAGVRPEDIVSPNLTDVYDQHLISRPLLAGVCLGSADAIYATTDLKQEHWWASPSDLTHRGRLLLHELNHLYARPAVLLTYLEFRPIVQVVPEAVRGTATVSAASGLTRDLNDTRDLNETRDLNDTNEIPVSARARVKVH